MNLDLRVAGRQTVAFRCGCFFARGDGTGVAGWRLCGEHAALAATVESAFGGADGECVVVCPMEVEWVRDGGAPVAYAADAKRS